MRLRLPDKVLHILHTLSEHGYDAYVVGGCVRDALLLKEPHDFDICTAATPSEIEMCFTGARIVRTGGRFGTLAVLLGGVPYEITTFRREGDYTDHRHPDNVFFTTDIVMDLRRRDFTINAMAYNPACGLVDPFCGENDLANGVLRCVGNPDERFNEDALRILRALRFAATLEFRIEDETKASMRQSASLLALIAPERIAAELSALLLGAHAEAALLHFPDILAVPIPEIRPCIGFDQHSKYHHLTVWAHTCLSVGSATNDPIVRLALLLHDIGKPACFAIGEDGYGHFYGHPEKSAEMAEAILRRLRYDAETVELVTCLVRYHDATLPATKPAARRWLHRIGVDALTKLLAVKRADAAAHANPGEGVAYVAAFADILSDVLAARDCFAIRDLAINGHAILRLGVPEGARVGAILSALLDEVMDGKIENAEEALLARARTLSYTNA